MMSSVAPLFIDGPLKGLIYRVPVSQLDHFLYRDGGTNVGTDDQPIRYHFHKFAILGSFLWIGSMQPIWGAIRPELLMELRDTVLSERAKEAMNR
jgi:hypothetical protein